MKIYAMSVLPYIPAVASATGINPVNGVFVNISGTSLGVENGFITNLSSSGNITTPSLTVTTGASSGTVLTSDSSGNATWQAVPSVLSQVLTGYSSTTGTVTATDTILSAVEKLNGNTSAVSTALTALGVPTSADTANEIVKRDGSGNFSAGAISIASGLLDASSEPLVSANSNFTNQSFYAGYAGASASTNITAEGNIGIGFGALNVVAPGGSFNTVMGNNACPILTSGSFNTSFGNATMVSLTTASNNTAVGNAALEITTSGNNTGVGYFAGITNTTGSNNTLVGYEADVTTGSLTNATAIGNLAKVSASNTVQLGNSSVTAVNTSGVVNSTGVVSSGNVSANGLTLTGNMKDSTATSSFLLMIPQFSSSNIFMGYSGNTSNTASGNTAMGKDALISLSSGSSNIGFGAGAGENITTGGSNTTIGSNALPTLQSGNNCTAVGASADVASSALSNSTAIGAGAIVSASNAIQLGNSSVTAVNTSGVVTAGGLSLPTSGGSPSTLSFFQEFNYTSTFLIGGTTTSAFNIYLSRIGRTVFLVINQTSNVFPGSAGSYNLVTAFPAQFRPLQITYGCTPVTNNGANALGSWSVSTSGFITVYAGFPGVLFTASTASSMLCLNGSWNVS
jgi:hypothetical protein